MSRTYTESNFYMPPRCEPDGCMALADRAAEYTEDTSYRYMDRWIESEIQGTAYFCSEHLPAEARELATAWRRKEPS